MRDQLAQAMNEPKNSPDMPAAPMIGVHVLSQFVFCPRAGLCAFENQRAAEDEDEPARANVDYVCRYDPGEIERRLEESMTWFWWCVGGLLFLWFVISLLIRQFHPDFALPGMLGVITLAILTGRQLTRAWSLTALLAAYRKAQPREPDPALEMQNVQWCDLLQAGFKSVAYRKLEDDRLGIQGKPWRVLRRGSLRIPVFLAGEDGRIHPKHLVKVAAYSHLLQVCEGYESPYGILLQEGSFTGTAVASTSRIEQAFHEALRQAHQVIERARDQRKDPGEPDQPSVCSGCWLGEPLRYVPGESEHRAGDKRLPILALTDTDNRTVYHSHCGDRYRWMPPHARVQQLELRPM